MVSLLRLLGVLTLSLATPSSWVTACESTPSMTTGTRGAGEPSGLVTNTCGQRRAGKSQVVWSEGRSWKRELAPHLTLMSKGMAGLKNLGVLVKWIWYGEVTIAIPLRAASTMSLPEGRRGKGPGRLPSCPSWPRLLPQASLAI